MSVGTRLSYKALDAIPRRFGTIREYVPGPDGPAGRRDDGWLIRMDDDEQEAIYLSRYQLAEARHNPGFGWRVEAGGGVYEGNFVRPELHMRMGRVYRIAVADGPGTRWDTLVFRGSRPDGKLVFQRLEPAFVDVNPNGLRYAREVER